MDRPDPRASLCSASSEDGLLAECAGLMAETLTADSCDLLLVGPSGSLVLRASTTMRDLIHRVRIGRDQELRRQRDAGAL